MSEKVDVLWVGTRSGFGWLGYWHKEVLIITPDRVIVARAPKKPSSSMEDIHTPLSIEEAVFESAIELVRKPRKRRQHAKPALEEFLKAHMHKYVIPKSEITKVELKKGRAGVKLSIISSKKEYEWYAKGWGSAYPSWAYYPASEESLRYYEDKLRPVFGDKLSVKK